MTTSLLAKHNEFSTGIMMLALSFACMALLRWGGEYLLPIVIVLAIPLVLLMMRTPRLGFVALPPLFIATSYPPAFNDPGTLLFILLSGVWIGTEIWHARTAIMPRHSSWLWKIAILTALMVVINFAAATHHGIAIGAWLRGLFPFMLLGLAIPLLLRKMPNNGWQFLCVAVGLTCLTLSAEILFVYCSNQLWESIATTSDLAQKFLHSAQGKHFTALNGDYAITAIKLRITLILPEAAGILPPLGAVGWALAAHATTKRYRWMAIAATAICFCAVVATATRSMVLCCGLSVGLTLLIYYWNNRERFFESLRIGVAVLAFSSPFLLSTPAFSDLLARNRDLIENIEAYEQGSSHLAVSSSKAATAAQDIGYRMQEYGKAWAAFIDAPLTGQGFGHAIKLAFPKDSSGEMAEVSTTYTHSWIFYWLMVAGVPGLLIYSLVIVAPLVRLRAFRNEEDLPLTLVLAGGAILLVSYGLFFAVYRTLPHVFCVTMLLAWAISSWSVVRKPSENRDVR